MEPNFFPKKAPKRKQESEDCKIEVKNTRSGKKIVIGKNCTREQIRMLQESGQINLKESEDNAS